MASALPPQSQQVFTTPQQPQYMGGQQGQYQQSGPPPQQQVPPPQQQAPPPVQQTEGELISFD